MLKAKHSSRLGELTSGCLVVEPGLLQFGWAKPEEGTGSHQHMVPPPVGMSVEVGCYGCQAAGEGGSLAMPTLGGID